LLNIQSPRGGGMTDGGSGPGFLPEAVTFGTSFSNSPF
jgi:hypothetical protein